MNNLMLSLVALLLPIGGGVQEANAAYKCGMVMEEGVWQVPTRRRCALL